MKAAKKFIVSGRVQGVGFRFFALRAANDLGLAGYVKNRRDGTVEAYTIGEPAQIEDFKRMISAGPLAARIDAVEETDEPVERRYKQFVIE